jgi:hypothetical protein
MEHRIYRQWPHENTFARSPQQFIRDLYSTRLLHRVGENVENPTVQITFANGKQLTGWIWDYSKTEDGKEYATLLVEIPGDAARSVDLTYFSLTDVCTVMLIASDVMGCELPPFTIKRKTVGPEIRRVDIERKALENSRAMAEFLKRQINLTLMMDKVEGNNQQQIVAYQEIMSRVYSAIYRASANDTFRRRFNEINNVVITLGTASTIQVNAGTLFAQINLDDNEPTQLSRKAIGAFLTQNFIE